MLLSSLNLDLESCKEGKDMISLWVGGFYGDA